MAGGRAFDIHPAGMLALDVSRSKPACFLSTLTLTAVKKALVDEAEVFTV
jgi:hypothetical protein